jgi:hypothetical protein
MCTVWPFIECRRTSTHNQYIKHYSCWCPIHVNTWAWTGAIYRGHGVHINRVLTFNYSIEWETTTTHITEGKYNCAMVHNMDVITRWSWWTIDLLLHKHKLSVYQYVIYTSSTTALTLWHPSTKWSELPQYIELVFTCIKAWYRTFKW